MTNVLGYSPGERIVVVDPTGNYFDALDGEITERDTGSKALIVTPGELDRGTYVYPAGPYFMRPTDDEDQGAEWTTPIWSKLDEVTPSDSDYTTATLFQFEMDDFRVGLSTPDAEPIINTDHFIRVRLRHEAGSTATWNVWLRQGGSVKASFSPMSSTSFATYEYELTTGQAAAITDYSDLNIRVQALEESEGGHDFDVSWIEFEVP